MELFTSIPTWRIVLLLLVWMMIIFVSAILWERNKFIYHTATIVKEEFSLGSLIKTYNKTKGECLRMRRKTKKWEARYDGSWKRLNKEQLERVERMIASNKPIVVHLD